MAATDKKDYYGILCLKKTATADDVRKELSEANEVLSDPKKRKIYDQLGFYSDNIDSNTAEAYANSGAGGNPFGHGGNPFGGYNQGAQHQEFDFRDFDFGNAQQGGRGGSFRDIFSGIFGGGMAQEPANAAGSDVEYKVQVPFWEAIRGGEMKLNIQRPSSMGRMIPEPVSFRIKPGTRDGQ